MEGKSIPEAENGVVAKGGKCNPTKDRDKRGDKFKDIMGGMEACM